MRVLLAFVIGLALGAATFHAWYLRLAPADRCGWDHPLADTARDACRAANTGYDAAARHALDRLIEDVGK